MKDINNTANENPSYWCLHFEMTLITLQTQTYTERHTIDPLRRSWLDWKTSETIKHTDRHICDPPPHNTICKEYREWSDMCLCVWDQEGSPLCYPAILGSCFRKYLIFFQLGHVPSPQRPIRASPVILQRLNHMCCVCMYVH